MTDRGQLISASEQDIQGITRRLIDDAGPLQFIREAVVNGLEAGASTITWGRHDNLSEDVRDFDGDDRYPKLRYTDNGCGMSPRGLVENTKNLGRTGDKVGGYDNRGIGQKVSGLRFSPGGVDIGSVQNGRAFEVRLWKNPDSSNYELARLSVGVIIENDLAKYPDLVRDSGQGTVIDFWGHSSSIPQDTTHVPPGYAGSKTNWVYSQMARQFYRIKTNTKIQTRFRVRHEKGKDDRLATDNFTPQGDWLRHNSEYDGTVALPADECGLAGSLRWFYLDEKVLKAGGSTLNVRNQQVGVVRSEGTHDEIYSLHTGRSGKALLDAFGVGPISRHMAIYVEVDATPEVHPDTARTRLLYESGENQDLPWPAWQEHFRNNLPPKLIELVNTAMGDRHEDWEEKEAEQLRQLADLLGPDAVVPGHSALTLLTRADGEGDSGVDEQPAPDSYVEDDMENVLGLVEHDALRRRRTAKARPATTLKGRKKTGGTHVARKATEADAVPNIRVVWISKDPWIDEHGEERPADEQADEIQYHAAMHSYVGADPVILASVDWHFWAAVLKPFEKAGLSTAVALAALRRSVDWMLKESYATAVKVASAEDDLVVEEFLTKEALTMTVAHPRQIINEVKRTLTQDADPATKDKVRNVFG